MIPPKRVRVFGDIVIPAVKTLMWFASSKETYYKFMDTANEGVVNHKLLGTTKSSALLHSLNSPILEKYNFSPVDFGKGAKLALQQY